MQWSEREENCFSSFTFNFVTQSLAHFDAVLFLLAYRCPVFFQWTCMNKTPSTFLAYICHFYYPCFNFSRKESFHFCTSLSPSLQAYSLSYSLFPFLRFPFTSLIISVTLFLQQHEIQVKVDSSSKNDMIRSHTLCRVSAADLTPIVTNLVTQ